MAESRLAEEGNGDRPLRYICHDAVSCGNSFHQGAERRMARNEAPPGHCLRGERCEDHHGDRHAL